MDFDWRLLRDVVAAGCAIGGFISCVGIQFFWPKS